MGQFVKDKEERQRILKELILELHDGKSVDDVKERFGKLIDGISVAEISEMEQNLMAEGMAVEEIQRLCDVHAEVLGTSVEEIHKFKWVSEVAGHPMHTFKMENMQIERVVETRLLPALEAFEGSKSLDDLEDLYSKLEELLEIDRHYSRKENLAFPYLESAGITAPPKVMWGVDDEIRRELKEALELLKDYDDNKDRALDATRDIAKKILDMIFKEENILFPLLMDTLTEAEWWAVYKSSDEYGYSFMEPRVSWTPENIDDFEEEEEEAVLRDDVIRFDSGFMTPHEIETLLDHLPIDITFVDKDDRVKYFSQSDERIFKRAKTVIGRNVENCHPPASVHIVNQIVEDFKNGVKDSEDFWLKMGERYILIRYFAVRDKKGEYLGTLEVSQDIAPLQKIEGEKRLRD